MAVGLNIKQVVDDVGRRSREAETEKGEERAQQAAGEAYVRVCQQQRQKDEQVLCPLMHAHGSERSREGTGAFIEYARWANATQAHSETQAQAGIGHHDFSRVGQHGQIGRGVADIAVLAAAELAAHAIQLVGSRQVDLAVAAQNAGKDTEMRGDPLGQPHVRSGYEIECTATRAFFVKILQQGAVVGQMRDVERDMRGDEFLEGSLAVQQAPRQSEQHCRMRARQHQQRVHKSVGLDQGSVEIDTERAECVRCRYRR